MTDTPEKNLQNELTDINQQCELLQQQGKKLLIASKNAQGEPDISYAPYVKDDQGHFYIFISELASHTRNLIGHPRCSVMILRDETQSRNLFARERLTYQCTVQNLPVADPDAEQILDLMEAKLGDTVKILRGLADFRLLRLSPQQGRYVVGFGKAYIVDTCSGELTHIGKDNLG